MGDIIDCVSTLPFLGFTLQVGMATIHFHIAQTGLFFRIFFSYLGGPKKQFGTNKNCSKGAQVGQTR